MAVVREASGGVGDPGAVHIRERADEVGAGDHESVRGRCKGGHGRTRVGIRFDGEPVPFTG